MDSNRGNEKHNRINRSIVESLDSNASLDYQFRIEVPLIEHLKYDTAIQRQLSCRQLPAANDYDELCSVFELPD